MNSGDTKTEAMLNVLGNGGSGDQFRGCCNTKTQSYILDAIDRINNLDPSGGGSDFKKLTDADKNYTLDGEDYIAVWLLEPGKYILADDATVPILAGLIEEDDGQGGTIDTPGAIFTSSEQPLLFLSVDEFENCEATIDNTIGVYYFALDEYHHAAAEQEFPVPQFGGTDGEYEGGDGLVPGPSTSDAGKFLCANGRWESVDGTILYVKPTEYDVFSSTTQSGIHFYKEDTFTTTYTAEDIRATLYGGGNMRIVVPDSSDPSNAYKHIMVFAGGPVLDQNSLGTNGMTIFFNYNANGDKVSLYLEDPTDTTFSLFI